LVTSVEDVSEKLLANYVDENLFDLGCAHEAEV
jgi:hypothetical protein